MSHGWLIENIFSSFWERSWIFPSSYHIYMIHIITYVCNPEEDTSYFTVSNMPQGHKSYYLCIIFVDFTNHEINLESTMYYWGIITPTLKRIFETLTFSFTKYYILLNTQSYLFFDLYGYVGEWFYRQKLNSK